ncbi:bifunctional riboflavin kinase/FAD synthetase [bacterium]|nr:bifunctional riboflavin kinase/FAD synthetase [bacterium]
MIEITSLEDCHFTEGDETVVALGFFDGVHRAHRLVISTCLHKARVRNGKAVVFTFQNHPTSVLSPQSAIRLLTPYPLKTMHLQSLGIDVLLAPPFNDQIRHSQPEQFIQTFLVDVLRAKELVVGYDFRFGMNRAGTLNLLQNQVPHRFEAITVIDQQCYQGYSISSTNIRHFVQQGDMETANQLLGHPFQVYGQVTPGQGRGRTIGIPTANLATGQQILPPNGVYGVQARIDTLASQPIWGVMNIGHVPTFRDNQSIHIEVHLFDFAQDIYDRHLIVDVLHPIREERRFSSPQELIAQIHADIHHFHEWIQVNGQSSL